MRSEGPPLEAVTIDAFGTLVELVDPVEPLRAALAAEEVERSPDRVAAAFAAEVAYYRPHAHEGRDAVSLARLRRDCAGVFLAALDADVDAQGFAPAFVRSLAFRPLPGVPGTLEELRALGLRVACVSNWDVSLADFLAEAGLTRLLDTVVSSAEAGAPKPDPRPFRLALERLGVEPDRALHVGDDEADRAGAAAAGLAFAPPPLSTLPARMRKAAE
jgi:putative hydrolase of the HAD superfamily